MTDKPKQRPEREVPDGYVPDFEISNPGDDPDAPVPYRPTTLIERRLQRKRERGSDNGK